MELLQELPRWAQLGIPCLAMLAGSILIIFLLRKERQGKTEQEPPAVETVEPPTAAVEQPTLPPVTPKTAPGIPIPEALRQHEMHDVRAERGGIPVQRRPSRPIEIIEKPPSAAHAAVKRPKKRRRKASPSGKYDRFRKGGEGSFQPDEIDPQKLERLHRMRERTSQQISGSVVAVSPQGVAQKVSSEQPASLASQPDVTIDDPVFFDDDIASQLEGIDELELEFSDGVRPDSDTRAVVPPGSRETAAKVPINDVKPPKKHHTQPGLLLDRKQISRMERGELPETFLHRSPRSTPATITPDHADPDDTVLRAQLLRVQGNNPPPTPPAAINKTITRSFLDLTDDGDTRAAPVGNNTVMGMRAIVVDNDDVPPSSHDNPKEKLPTEGWELG